MGNLSSTLNQNIQEFANNLIEQERSKNNSLNHSSNLVVSPSKGTTKKTNSNTNLMKTEP